MVLEDGHGARGEGVGPAAEEAFLALRDRRPLGVEDDLPLVALDLRQAKRDAVVVRVEQDHQRVVDQAPAPLVAQVGGVARQPDGQRADRVVVPLLLRHLLAVGAPPGEVLDVAAAQRAARK